VTIPGKEQLQDTFRINHLAKQSQVEGPIQSQMKSLLQKILRTQVQGVGDGNQDGRQRVQARSHAEGQEYNATEIIRIFITNVKMPVKLPRDGRFSAYIPIFLFRSTLALHALLSMSTGERGKGKGASIECLKTMGLILLPHAYTCYLRQAKYP
jgi:hypothetical protein